MPGLKGETWSIGTRLGRFYRLLMPPPGRTARSGCLARLLSIPLAHL